MYRCSVIPGEDWIRNTLGTVSINQCPNSLLLHSYTTQPQPLRYNWWMVPVSMKYRLSPGPVLHQPLNCAVFWFLGQKRRNMNGVSCIPRPKNGERPYLAVPEPVFPGLFFGHISAIFYHSYPSNHAPIRIYFLFIIF